MDLLTALGLGQTALELGLVYSLAALALFLSYSMLNVCDLSTEGSFILGGAVGAVVAMSGHPLLSIPAAMLAGMTSGFVTAFLQTRMGVDSLLAGIIVNTGLYSVNMAIMGANLNLFKTSTVFTMAKDALAGTPLAGQFRLVVELVFVAVVIVLLVLFLKTKLGLAIRATGDNPDMVRSSSISPIFTTTIGLCVSNALTALSGCLQAQSQKSLDIKDGIGVLTSALASLLIGRTLMGKGPLPLRAAGMVVGSFLFRLVYAIALRFDIPSYMLRLVSSVILVLTIFLPYLKNHIPELARRFQGRKEGAKSC